jgi:hypothetical protein
MTNQHTPPRRLDGADPRRLERTRRQFLLARAQLGADRVEPLRVDAERRDWSAHERRFS